MGVLQTELLRTRNRVTGSLMAITVITVGTLNCFFAGPNDVEGRRSAIREAKGRVGRGEEASGVRGRGDGLRD